MADAGLTGLLALGLLVGAVSAVSPFLPVEAYVIAIGVTQSPAVAIGGAVAAAVGQTAGKLLLFGAARSRGPARLVGRLRARGEKATVAVVPDAIVAAAVHLPRPDRRPVRRFLGRLGQQARRANRAAVALLSGRSGPAVVLLSGAVGLPPLLPVAFYAGASTMRTRAFVAACLTGRTARFALLAVVPGFF